MSDYKRLNQNISILDMHNHSFKSVKQLTDGKKTENQVIDEIVHDTIELLDKIEQGTLIELPCKVGDTVYWLIANKYIIECVVSLINISVGKKTHFTVYAKQKCEGAENDFSSDDLGEEWFITREEAEKRLKELQE